MNYIRIRLVAILLAVLASAVLLLTPYQSYMVRGPFIFTLIYTQIMAAMEMRLPFLLFNSCALLGPVLLIFASIFFRCSVRRYVIFTIIFVVGSMILPFWLSGEAGNVIARRMQWLPAMLAIASAVTYRIAARKRDKMAELERSRIPRPPRKPGPTPPSLKRNREGARAE